MTTLETGKIHFTIATPFGREFDAEVDALEPFSSDVATRIIEVLLQEGLLDSSRMYGFNAPTIAEGVTLIINRASNGTLELYDTIANVAPDNTITIWSNASSK